MGQVVRSSLTSASRHWHEFRVAALILVNRLDQSNKHIGSGKARGRSSIVLLPYELKFGRLREVRGDICGAVPRFLR